MRIITPENAAFSPSGPGTPIDMEISDVRTGTISADGIQAPIIIGSISQNGGYMYCITVELTNSTASAGTLNYQLSFPYAGPFLFNVPLNANTLDIETGDIPVEAGDVTLDWSVTGFGTGSVDYKIISSVIKLF